MALALVGCEGCDKSPGDSPSNAPVAAPEPPAAAETAPVIGSDAGIHEHRRPVPWRCPAGPFGKPIPPGVTPVRVAGVPPSDAFNQENGVFGIVEGPVWLGDVLYFSEIGAGPNPPPARIFAMPSAGALQVAVPDSGSNGLAVDKDGNLYAAMQKDGSVSRVDLAAATATPIVSSYEGQRFNSPNDLAIRSDGNIYFSDPDYQAPSPAPQAKTRVYRIAPIDNSVSVVDETLKQPNGVTLSLDEKTLYVAAPTGVTKYAVADDGSVGSQQPFAPTVTNGDGMTLDCAGNLYVSANKGVTVLDPTGKKIGILALKGIQGATNVAFGGADRKTLYITALGSKAEKGLFSVQLAVPGMPY